MGIGTVLSDLLREKNTNAKALADQIGVTPSTIYSIIKRDNSKVEIDTLMKICKALDVSVEKFYDEYVSSKPDEVFSEEEKTMMKDIRSLTEEQREVIGYQIKVFKEYNEMNPPK